jgi:DNA polymerase-3 subunit epsilon
MRDYVAFDLETTGLSPQEDQIIEIGAVKIRDGKISGKYNCIIHPEIEVSDFIMNLTGISKDMLDQGIPLKEGVEGFLEFSRNFPVLGHNVMFDYKFMKMAAASFKYSFEREGVDTLSVARKLLSGLENKKLETLCAHYHYVNEAAHRAYDDALATAVVFEQMKKEFPDEKDIFLPKQLQYKVKKERPATEKQKRYLMQLMQYHAISESIDLEQMTQREASKKIDNIILNYGVMKK